MRKIISGLLILALTFSCLAMLVGCNERETTETEIGLVYSVEKDEKGAEYAVVKKYGISEDDAKKVADGNYGDILVELNINEYVQEEGADPIPVKEIAPNAFANQLVIKKITFGSNVEKIGAGALSGCARLEELILPFAGESADAKNSAKNIGYIFGSTSFTGGTSVTAQHNSSEEGATTYYIPSSLKIVTVTGDVLSDYAFFGMPFEEVVLSGSIDVIGEAAFSSMTALTVFNVPASVKEIGKFAFKNSTALYKVDFSKATQLEIIWQEAFMGCILLGYGGNNLVLPSSLKTIYNGAFKNCTSLKSIDLSNTAVTNVPSACFYGCTSLKTATVSNAATISNYAFPTDNEGFNLVKK